MKKTLALLSLVSLIAAGCSGGGDTVSKEEINNLKNPSGEPPAGASAGPPPGMEKGANNSLDPNFKPKGEVQKY